MSGDGPVRDKAAAPKAAAPAREDRLAARLRENLKRRKDQARARETPAAGGDGLGEDADGV